MSQATAVTTPPADSRRPTETLEAFHELVGLAERRIGRIYRLGQSRPIEVYNLVCEGGIESRIAQIVGNKQAFFKGLFDGNSDEVAFDGGGRFLERLERTIRPVPMPAVTGDEPETDRELASADAEAGRAGAPPEEDQAPREVAEQPAAEDRTAEQTASFQQGTPGTATRVQIPGGGVSIEELGALFAKLAVERRADGLVTITAPPEAAATLASVFAGMAGLMQQAATAGAGTARAGLPS